jgi:hypothetical protein
MQDALFPTFPNFATAGGWQSEVFKYLTSSGASLTRAQIAAIDANIKAIKYGSGIILASVTGYLSTVNGTALATGLSVDPRPYVMTPGWKIAFADSAGKIAYGYGKAAGTGETYLETVVNGDNEAAVMTVTTAVRDAISQSNEQAQTGAYSAKHVCSADADATHYTRHQVAALDGTLYRHVSATYLPSGQALNTIGFGWDHAGATGQIVTQSTTTNAWVNRSSYKTALGGTALYAIQGVIPEFAGNINSQYFYTDNTDLEKVLTPSETGLTLTSTAGGATFNWASIEAGFNPNSASFTVTITRS